MSNNIMYKWKTTIWIDFKSLRFNFMNYLMLVVIFPLSYLVVNLTSSSKGTNIRTALTGMLISMLMSMFINMFTSQVASSNTIEAIELFSMYKVKPLTVFMGHGLFHWILSSILMIPSIMIIGFSGFKLNILAICLFYILSFLFLYYTSLMLGSLIKNPNFAQPLINLIYMILIMITPIYVDPAKMSFMTRSIYSINPFSHFVWLFYSISYATNPGIIFSIIYLVIFTLICALFVHKKWDKRYAVEKLSLI